MDVGKNLTTDHNKICSVNWKQSKYTKLPLLYWDLETLLKLSSSPAGVVVRADPWPLLAIGSDPVTFVSNFVFPSGCNR